MSNFVFNLLLVYLAVSGYCCKGQKERFKMVSYDRSIKCNCLDSNDKCLFRYFTILDTSTFSISYQTFTYQNLLIRGGLKKVKAPVEFDSLKIFIETPTCDISSLKIASINSAFTITEKNLLRNQVNNLRESYYLKLTSEEDELSFQVNNNKSYLIVIDKKFKFLRVIINANEIIFIKTNVHPVYL